MSIQIQPRLTHLFRGTAVMALLVTSAALAQSSPDAFTYVVRTGQATNGPVTSESKTMTGYTGSLPVSVGGAGSPQYSIGGGAFTSNAGTISAGQALRMRHTSSTHASSDTISTVTVGGYSTTFKSVTGTVDRTPDPFDFGTKLNTFPNTFVESAPQTLTDFNTSVTITPGTGAQYRVDSGNWTNASGTLLSGQVLQMRHLTSTADNAFTKTSLTVGGVTGHFTTRNRSNINQLPIADAGADQEVDENAAVTLDGSASADAEGAVTYAWEQTGGPDVTLANANTATPSFTAPEVDGDDVLSFELTVTDDVGATASDEVQVTVADTRVLSIADAQVDESAGTIEFVVTVTPNANKTITVDYETADGTALSGADFEGGSGTLTIPAGGTQVTIVIPVTDDTFDEDDETFTVGLSDANGAGIENGLATGTIHDDDTASSSLLATLSALCHAHAGALEAICVVPDTLAEMFGDVVPGLDDPSAPDGVWLRGDMHVHDDHSSDGSGMRQTMGQGAAGTTSVSDQIHFAESQRLDFMALTDHRTFDQHYDPLWTSDRLLLLTGEEANSSPHANVFGAMDMINQAENPAGVPEVRKLQQSIWDAHAQGAAWSTNHPDDGEVEVDPATDRPKLGEHGSITPNANAFATGPDLVELWNRGTLTRPKIAYCENRWNAGYRFGIAGASDNHFREIWAIAGPGTPMTHVLSAAHSTPALLDALRAGRSVINMGDRSPFATLTGDFDGDGQFETVGGDEARLPSGATATLRVSTRNAVGTTVHVYRAPGEYAGAPAFRTFTPTLPQQNFDFTVAGGQAQDWYRVEVRGPGEPDALDYNKVLSGEPQSSYDPDVANPLRAATSPIFISAGAFAAPDSPQLPADQGATDGAVAIAGSASDNAFAGFAALDAADGLVHTVAEVRADSVHAVVYRARGAGGALSAPVTLSESGLARQPALAARGSDVWVAFQDQDGERPHNPQIFLRHSSDAGASWTDAIQLSASASRAQRPSIALLDASTPVVVWEDNSDGAFDVVASIAGASPVNLSAAGKTVVMGNGIDSRSAIHPASVSPKVAVRADGTIVVAWQDNRNDEDPGWTGHMIRPGLEDVQASIEDQELHEAGTETDDWEILAATFAGGAWSAPVNVSNSPAQADRHATLAFAADGTLHAAWDSKDKSRPAGPRLEIRASRSVDAGASWIAPQAVAKDASYSSQRPVFGRNGDALSLLWTDGRSADWRWRVMRAPLSSDGSFDAAAFVTGKGNATWAAYDNGFLAFTSDRAATREQRKPHQVFLLALDAPAVEAAAGTPAASGVEGTRGVLAALLDGDLAGALDSLHALIITVVTDLGGGDGVGAVDHVAQAINGTPASQGAAVFRVGTGEADHNPKTRTCIGGGSTICGRDADPSDPNWIRDPLISKATAITGANGQTFIVVTTTNIGYFLAYKAEQSGMNGIYDVRLRIARATGVPSTNVTVVSDHSHNGPDTIGIWGGVSAEYMKITADAVVKAAVQAHENRRDAIIKVAAINQNDALEPGVPLLDSSYDTAPGNDRSRGNPYNEFRLMTADDATTGDRILTFVNYAPHATVTNGDDGGHRLTGDWAAWMPQEAERIYGGMGLATVGALGSTDWNKSGNVAQKEAEARGRLRTLMERASAKLAPVQGNQVQVESTFIREELMQPALLLNYKPGHDRNNPAIPTDGYDVRIDRSTTPPFMTGTVAGTYISAARIGDVFFSMFPGEPFGELNHALVDEGRVQGPRVHFLLGGANDFFGYMVKNLDTYEQTLRTGVMYLPGCPEEDVAKQVGIRDPEEGACADHWSLMVSPTFGSHIVCTLQNSADRLGFKTANRDAECPVWTALDGLAPPPESGSLAGDGSLAAREAAVQQARELAEQCRTTAAPAALCDQLAEGARQAGTYLGTGAVNGSQARAGVAVKDASWHLGASAGQFSDTGVGIANDRGFDPYGHSTRKVGADTLGTRITTRALVVEGANGARIAIASNDLYLPNDLLHRRTAQLLAEHDALALATGGVVTGITDTNLATTSSHSHTSPFYSTPAWGTWIFQDVMDLRFFEYMARQMADAVIEAASTMKPVRMGGATVHANDIQAHTYGPKNVADGTPAGQPRDYTTQAVTVVSFDDISTGTPKPLANWVTFGVHPEWVWGEEIVNGDITHAVMRMLDRETGATTVWSQRETGSSGPHKDARVHDPAMRREFQESNFAGYDRAARLLTDSIKRALGQLATNQPERPDQFAPYQTGFAVASVSQRVAPPLTRPYPGVANCNTDPLIEGHVGAPIVPEPPECGYETDAVTVPVVGALPVNPVAIIAQQLKDAGVPIPTSYGISSFTGVQETMAVHLQAFKLGTIAATLSPNEQFTSQALSIESRLDKVAGNLWHGFDWACVAQARGLYPADAAGSKEAAHCARQNARYPEHGVQIPGSVNDEDFPRARAQIHNDAAGWELDPAYAAQNGDTSSAETLGGEAEPQDIAKIKGNFTHEEFTGNGYDLVVSVGMANDYWGYMAEYREYRAHSDGYRKGLNALGPHGADFVATRLARMAANLNGASAALPFNPLDKAYQAEAVRADTFARTMGELARAYTIAYEATLPPDGGAPGIVAQPADTVKRFSAAALKFIGGSNYTDMPYVRVERRVNGAWKAYGTQEGEVQLQLQFIPNALSQGGSSPLGDAAFGMPDPASLALWRAGQFEWVWTATFEAFVSELPNLGERPGVTPDGTYRFVVDGRHRGLLNFPGDAPYHIESEPFEVVAWDGITIEDLRVEADGRVSFAVGPITLHTTFMNGAKTDETRTRNPGYVVGPVDYPDSYAGGLSWVRNERQLFAGEQQYCGRCSFRPWADTAQLATTQIPVTARRPDGSEYTLTATQSGGRWITVGAIAAGDTAFVAAHAIVDQYGEKNGATSTQVTRGGTGPVDTDDDGVVDAEDNCPNEAGPASNDGCPMVTPPDTDGDGVPDSSDECDTEPGPASNQGCPEQVSQGFPVRFEELCDPTPFEAGCMDDIPGVNELQAALDEAWDTVIGGGHPANPLDQLIANAVTAIDNFTGNLAVTLENLAASATVYAGNLAASPETAPGQVTAAAQDMINAAAVVNTGNPWIRRRPLNISHRGGEQDWPENTMYAYAESIRQAGSDMIEMDIHETADGELVVIHDDSVDRTTNGAGAVSSLTLAQIQALDAAYWFAQDDVTHHGTDHGRPDAQYVYRGIATGAKAAPASYRPEDFRIPALREIFENPAFANVFINIELKPDPDSTGQYEAKLAAMIREYGRQDDVIVAAFLDHNLALFKTNAPEIATSVPTGQAAVDKGAGSIPSAPQGTHPGLGATVAHKAFQVPMDFEGIEVITEEYIADAHARGMAVHAWTINERGDMVQLLNWCVDGIMSDKPLLLEEVLQSGEWTCPLDAPTAAAALSHFVGSLHEHSGWSDGEIDTSPADYFDAGIFHGLDFVAGSEHSDNAMAPVTANTDCFSFDFPDCFQPSPDGVQKWSATGTIADAKNDPGRFSAIRGFEWTSDRFGHINVFFSQHDLNAKTSTGYSVSMEDFWRWLALPPSHRGGSDGLAVFNHPGREDQIHRGCVDEEDPSGTVGVDDCLGNHGWPGDAAYAWSDLAYRPEHDNRVVGIEMYGKSGDYYDGDNNAPAGGWYAHALGKGWHVAPVGAEDEHGTSWARPERAKTVMLARENSRAALRGAMSARRFYALRHGHGDIRLDFSAGGRPMGSRLSGVGTSLAFQVAVTDANAANGVAAARIEVVGAGGAVLEEASGLTHAFDAAASSQEQWRFVRVLDAGGKVLAISAPIWFRN